jgi:hypothetical protein
LLAKAFRPHYNLLVYQFGCYSFVMNKHSATKKRPAKISRNRGVRKASARKPARRAAARKPAPPNGRPIAAIGIAQLLSKQVSAPPPSPLATLRTHKFSVGQTVSYTSSPISRPGASGSYKVVRLLPSDGDDYQYRIKNSGEAFERVAKESQLELEM